MYSPYFHLFQSHFERLSGTKLKKRKKIDSTPIQNLIQRHAGVLGLSAYVQAYPYEVPEFMPQILMDLSEHVNDPQPIQVFMIVTIPNIYKLLITVFNGFKFSPNLYSTHKQYTSVNWFYTFSKSMFYPLARTIVLNGFTF